MRFGFSRLNLGHLVFILFLSSCTSDSRQEISNHQTVLRIAVTTSMRDSGLLDELIPAFEVEREVRVDVIAVGSGAALKLGETGDIDVVLVHAREAEDRFLAAGHGVRREDVMYNMFEILGPTQDPANIRDSSPETALLKIAQTGQIFLSRGDDSGTYKCEMKLWENANLQPSWSGYLESGQGMGATLMMADEMSSYVLTDHGTYLKFKNQIDLVPLVVDSESLRNPYGIIVVDPQKIGHSANGLADEFVSYMISPQVQRTIKNFTIDNEQLFFPFHPAEDY